MRTRRRARGSTLVMVVLLTAVLTIVALAMVQRGIGAMESATAKKHYDVALSCADGAREMLLSQFRSFGVNVTSLQLDRSVGGRRYASGHFDRFGLQTVTPVDRSMVGGGSEVAMDVTNRTINAALGGSVYRVTVVCSSSSAADRQSEVEFLVRFGL